MLFPTFHKSESKGKAVPLPKYSAMKAYGGVEV